MHKTVKLEVITPSKMFYKGDVELVVVTTPDGQEGFMANHSWAVKLVDIGSIRIREAGEKEMREAFVSGGYIDVKEDIMIYVDAAEWVEEIDYEKAVRQKGQAEEFLKSVSATQKTASEHIAEVGGDALPPHLLLEVDRMERKHRRAVARIQLVEKREKRRGH